jgi:hypothetical protein
LQLRRRVVRWLLLEWKLRDLFERGLRHQRHPVRPLRRQPAVHDAGPMRV